MDLLPEDFLGHDRGVGATAEARLKPLTPLIEFYAREMGELPGRLMIATNFLGDVQLMPAWTAQTAEVRQAVEQAQALIVSVMIRLLNAQGDCDCGGSSTVRELQRLIDRQTNGQQS